LALPPHVPDARHEASGGIPVTYRVARLARRVFTG
jgi:hypothetical protein